jgi:hypothetical protein
VFLKLRFPKALRLYYNVRRVRLAEESHDSIFKAVQREINRVLIEQGEYSECPLEFDRTLILVLSPGNEDKAEKIFKYLKVLIGPIVSIFTKAPHNIPEQYAEFEFSPKLRIQYKKEYNDLQKLKFEHMIQKQQLEVTRKSDDQIRSQSFFADRQQKGLGGVISITGGAGASGSTGELQQHNTAQSLQSFESQHTSAKKLQCDSFDSSSITLHSKSLLDISDAKCGVAVAQSPAQQMSVLYQQTVQPAAAIAMAPQRTQSPMYYANYALPMNNTYVMAQNPYVYFNQQQPTIQQQYQQQQQQ